MATFNTVNSPGRYVWLSGLQINTTYYIRAKATANGVNFTAPTTVGFITSPPSALSINHPELLTSNVPTGIHFEAIGDGLAEVEAYDWELKTDTGTVVEKYGNARQYAFLEGADTLAPNSSYQIRVRSSYPSVGQTGSWSDWVDVNTGANTSAREVRSYITSVTELENTQESVRLYPNPAVSEVNLELNQEGNYQLLLMDLTGKVITNFDCQAGTQTISLNGVARGMYSLTIYRDGKLYKVVKLAVSK